MPRFSFLAAPVSDEIKALVGKADTQVWWWRHDGEWRPMDKPVDTQGAATIALVLGLTDGLPDLDGSELIIQVKDPTPLPPPVKFPGTSSLSAFAAHMKAALPYTAVEPRKPNRPQ